jgi:hypothetical protein
MSRSRRGPLGELAPAVVVGGICGVPGALLGWYWLTMGGFVVGFAAALLAMEIEDRGR